jgi:hypothetical protein
MSHISTSRLLRSRLAPLLLGGLLAASATHAQTGSVGIGTTTPNPAAALDISAADSGQRVAISAPPDGLMVFQKDGRRGLWYSFGGAWVFIPDAARARVQAANGLTTVGTTVQLGGALTVPTTTLDAGQTNTLALQSTGAAPFALDQNQLTSAGSLSLNTARWQSFTAGQSGLLRRVALGLDVLTAGTLLLTIRQGEGTGGAVLSTQSLTTTMTGSGLVDCSLTNPPALTAGQVYTLAVNQSSGVHTWQSRFLSPYAGGRADLPDFDYRFATYMGAADPVGGLTLANGRVRLTGLSGPALLNVAPDGTVGTQTFSSVGDDLGNHTATRNLNLGTNELVGNGGTSGLRISSGGLVGIGTATPRQTLDVAGNVAVSGPLGVVADGVDRPIITRAWDAFTSGNYQSAGCWGMFMEPNALTFGVPDNGGGRRFQWVRYAANSTITNQLMSLSQTGDLSVAGNVAVSGPLGVVADGADRPLITRGWDPFTSGNYQNAGRWGVFMEPNALTFGVPDNNTGRRFQWVRYAANSTITNQLMSLSQTGDLAVAGQVAVGYVEVNGDFTVPGNSRSARSLSCPAGTRLLGGGGGHRDFNGAATDIRVHYSGPDLANPTTTWRMIVSNTDGNSRAIRIYCICARIAP